MKKLRILIDVDGIVADTLPHWLDYLGRKTGVVAQVSDINLYDLSKCPPLDKLSPKVIFGVLQDPGFTTAIAPMPGVARVLQGLMDDGHEVYLVTARSGSQHINETFEWLKTHLPFIDTRKQLIFCYDKHIIPADVLIDDQAATLTKYGETHPNALLLGISYLYNQGVRATLVDYGVDAWPAIDQQILLRATQLEQEERTARAHVLAQLP